MKKQILTAAMITILSGSAALAQSPFSGRAPSPAYSPAVIQHHASTFEEGVQRGAADLVRANGDYNYNTSLALIFREQARSLAFDNAVKKVNTYFQKRAINRGARADEEGGRPTAQDVARYNKSRLPARLAAHQYRPTGSLHWPEALQGDSFAVQREAIDTIAATRLTGKNTEIKQLTAEMTRSLKSQIRQLNPTDYVAAKRFLRSLEYEMQLPAVVGSVAAR